MKVRLDSKINKKMNMICMKNSIFRQFKPKMSKMSAQDTAKRKGYKKNKINFR